MMIWEYLAMDAYSVRPKTITLHAKMCFSLYWVKSLYSPSTVSFLAYIITLSFQLFVTLICQSNCFKREIPMSDSP